METLAEKDIRGFFLLKRATNVQNNVSEGSKLILSQILNQTVLRAPL